MSDPRILTAQAQEYFHQGLFEAAVDLWIEITEEHPHCPLVAQAYDGIGKVAVQRARPAEALVQFDHALGLISDADREAQVGLAMRRAIALDLVGSRDQAFREAQALVDASSNLSAPRRGILLTNLAGLYMNHALYSHAIEALQEARDLLRPLPRYEYPLSVNMGTCQLALGNTEAARQWFERALRASPHSAISAVTGLAHVAWLEGEPRAMQQWGETAFAMMWDGLMSFDPEELAHLADVLGQMALEWGHGRLAMRLFDHAQDFYGRSGHWNRWRSLNATMAVAEALPESRPPRAEVSELTRFTLLLEHMVAQELVVPHASNVADIRLFIASRIAERLGGRSGDPRNSLTYVCRLADVGLSVVGSDVATNPDNLAPAARNLYQQHPIMSVRLLDRLGLPSDVVDGILDHHERWDGSGFPEQKSGRAIALYAQIFAVADLYARQTAVEGSRHRTVIRHLAQESGRSLSPDCVAAFVALFRVPG